MGYRTEIQIEVTVERQRLARVHRFVLHLLSGAAWTLDMVHGKSVSYLI